ncbi:MAG TPA: response regulator transcription factor [Bacteroidia bacterium]|nr:response regulator transcription factor [Bacteroidia bacterium]
MKILIADDQEMILYALNGILIAEYPTAQIQEVTNGLQLEKLARTQTFDIIISDMVMPDKSGLDVLKQLRLENIKTPMLIVSIYPENQYALRVLKAGGNGYFLKGGSLVDFLAAVKTVVSGRKYISPQMTQNLSNQFDHTADKEQHELISDRELEVLKHIAAGKMVSEIADLLTLSIATISTYRQRLLEKMHMRNNAELMHYAILHHLEN